MGNIIAWHLIVFITVGWWYTGTSCQVMFSKAYISISSVAILKSMGRCPERYLNPRPPDKYPVALLTELSWPCDTSNFCIPLTVS